MADVQRVFPYEAPNAIVMRSGADKVAVGEWLFHELGRPSADPARAHQTQLPGVPDGMVRVFYLAHRGRAADLQALTTQLRAARIQWVFPYTQPAAVVVRGFPDQIGTAEAMIAKFDTSDR
jgi:hypothetical protein